MRALRQQIRLFDRLGTSWATHLPGRLRPTLELSSFVGQPYIMVMVGLEVLGYGFRFAAWPVMWAGAAVVALLPLSAIAKRLWRRVRPETAAALGLHNYSFPSGHAYGSTLIIGLLAVLAALAGGVWLALAGGLVALIISVGVSRVYLGAHYPSDVVAGWLLGLVVLGLVVIGAGL